MDVGLSEMTAESQDLRCPRDTSPLEIVIWEEWQYGSCPQCHGIFIERSELERLCGAHDALPPDDVSKGPERAEAVEALLRCSCDGRPLMHRSDRDGVAIDVCSNCGAYWFDANEIEEYLDAREADDMAGEPRRLGVEQAPWVVVRTLYNLFSSF